jgi:tellurite resistance protein TehA-like permease
VTSSLDELRAPQLQPDLVPETRRFFTRLDRPGNALANLTPNWFACVMGTGIVANAAVSLPVQVPGLRTAAHWLRHPDRARRHHRHPVIGHFYGAPPMAMMTVGSGALLVGHQLIGLGPALAIDTVLWVLGTVGGLITAVAIPYWQFTSAEPADRAARPRAFGGWLMPVVPPMVSATTGGQLLPYLPAGQARLTMLLACWAMFGMSLVASVVVITMIWSRLAHRDLGPAAMVPTLWIVLGPLGQSITASGVLCGDAHLAVGRQLAGVLSAAGLLYGVPTLGFALLWVAVAGAITIRTARTGLPFSLTWWSFTFPVGTCATGLSVLAAQSGSTVLAGLAVAFYLGLVLAWITVTARTAHGALRTGALLA